MNKKYLALILPLLLTVSCGPTSTPTETPTEAPTTATDPSNNMERVLENLLNNVNIKVTGTEKYVYPEGLEAYNVTNYINIDRDYAKIVEEDGSLTPAVRDNTQNRFVTYIKAKDGSTYNEILDADNTVLKQEFKINYNKVLYNEHFGNPFEYVDVTDIDENGNLNKTKTNYLVQLLTGLSISPKSSVLSFDGSGHATSLKIESYPRYDIIDAGVIIEIETTYDLLVEFDYNVEPIYHLQPRANADEHITSALSNKTNYTLQFRTDMASTATTIYVTEEAIFVQNDSNATGASDGDMFYKKGSNGTYESYVYKSSVGKFNIDELSVDVKHILPDLTTINPNIVINESGKVYSIDSTAALNSLDNFVIPNYPIGDGFGINGTIILDENDNISQFRGKFFPQQPFNVVQNYYDYGTTSMPSWLDVDSIR